MAAVATEERSRFWANILSRQELHRGKKRSRSIPAAAGAEPAAAAAPKVKNLRASHALKAAISKLKLFVNLILQLTKEKKLCSAPYRAFFLRTAPGAPPTPGGRLPDSSPSGDSESSKAYMNKVNTVGLACWLARLLVLLFGDEHVPPPEVLLAFFSQAAADSSEAALALGFVQRVMREYLQLEVFAHDESLLGTPQALQDILVSGKGGCSYTEGGLRTMIRAIRRVHSDSPNMLFGRGGQLAAYAGEGLLVPAAVRPSTLLALTHTGCENIRFATSHPPSPVIRSLQPERSAPPRQRPVLGQPALINEQRGELNGHGVFADYMQELAKSGAMPPSPTSAPSRQSPVHEVSAQPPPLPQPLPLDRWAGSWPLPPLCEVRSLELESGRLKAELLGLGPSKMFLYLSIAPAGQ